MNEHYKHIFNPNCKIAEYPKGSKIPPEWGDATFGCDMLVFSLDGIAVFACPQRPMVADECIIRVDCDETFRGVNVYARSFEEMIR